MKVKTKKTITSKFKPKEKTVKLSFYTMNILISGARNVETDWKQSGDENLAELCIFHVPDKSVSLVSSYFIVYKVLKTEPACLHVYFSKKMVLEQKVL